MNSYDIHEVHSVACEASELMRECGIGLRDAGTWTLSETDVCYCAPGSEPGVAGGIEYRVPRDPAMAERLQRAATALAGLLLQEERYTSLTRGD